MNFTSHIVPVKFYADLTEAQFNYLEKSEDIFYQVNGVGLFKGSTLIASVGSNVDLSYVDNQINNLRNQFNATVQSDGTVLLTIKGQNYTLATPSSVGNGGIEIIEPEDDEFQYSGNIDNQLASMIYNQREANDFAAIFEWLRNQADEDNTRSVENGLYINSTYNGSPFYAYLCNKEDQAKQEYNSRSLYLKIRIGTFVYFQPVQYSPTSTPQEEGVVVINNPYDVQTYMEDGGLVYDITSKEPEEVPNIYWGNGEDLTIEMGTNYPSTYAYVSPHNDKYEIWYESSDPEIVEVDRYYGSLTPKSIGTATIRAKLIYLADGHPVSTITKGVTVIAALPTFDVQGMGGGVKYIEGQTWADWIENYPNIGQNSYIAPYFSVYNGYEVGYGMSAEELADYIAHGYITQEQYDEVYPLIVAGVRSTDLIQSKTYYFKINTAGIESDENPVGEGQFAFTIGGERFIANEGMNLSQWIDSKYNTAGFVIKNNKAVVKVFENNVICEGGMYCAIMYGSSEFIGLDDVLKENDTFELLVYAPAYELDPNIRISSYRDEAYIGENFNVYWEANNINSSVLLYSSDTSVATISKNRTVNAVGAGTAIITVEGDGVSDSFTLTVKAADKGQSINNPFDLRDFKDISETRDCYVRGVIDSVTRVDYSYNITLMPEEGSLNNNYMYGAVLEENPSVTTPVPGDTIIFRSGFSYLKESGLHFEKPTIVSVEHPVQYSFTLSEHSIELPVGEIHHLGYNISPNGADIEFTSSDNSIVSVDEIGKIYGVNPGMAIVTATATFLEEGGTRTHYDSVEVTVTQAVAPEEPDELRFSVSDCTQESKATLVFENIGEEVGARFFGRPIGNAEELDENGVAVDRSDGGVFDRTVHGDFFGLVFNLSAEQAAKFSTCKLYCDAKPASYLNQDFWARSNPNETEWTPGYYIDENHEDGTYIANYRYILYVDGQPVEFDPEIQVPAKGSNNNMIRDEYVVPYTFHLHSGVNNIEIRMAGGYRSTFFNFIFRPVEGEPQELQHGTTLEDPLTPEEAITLMNEANLHGQYLNDGATYYVVGVVDHLLGNNVYLSQYLNFYATNPEEFGVGDTVLISGQLYAKTGNKNYKIKNFIIISITPSSPVVPQTYTITFKNYDNTVLQTLTVNEGETPVYSGEIPTRPDDEEYSYTFLGWDSEIVPASNDAVYTAVFNVVDPNAPVQVSTFNDLEWAIQNGKNVVLASNIETDESLAEVLYSDVEVNLNNYTLACSKFMLTASDEGNTITIKNGKIVTTEGVTISAPNGSVILDNVKAYDANGEINLAASSNSLHLKGTIWFRSGTPESAFPNVRVKVANGTRMVIENETIVSAQEFVVTNDSFIADAEATITLDNFSKYAYITVEGNFVNNNEISTLAQLQAAAANGGNYTLVADISGLSSSQRVNFVKDARLILNGHSITSTYLGPCVLNGANLTIDGDYNNMGGAINAVEGCAMAFDGSTLNINGGTYTCSDNFVFGTNGSTNRGNNAININGGTFNGNIVSAGYVACGVYVANNDYVSIMGGTFNITNGVGVLARSGITTLKKSENGLVFNVTGDGTLGKVGDSQVTVPSGQVLVLDLKANYPGGTPSINNQTDYSVYTIEA